MIDEIELDTLESDSHDDIVWGRITIQDASPVYVGSYYRSTSSYSGDTITSLQSSLDLNPSRPKGGQIYPFFFVRR